MEIAIIAHDLKKELMTQFCIAYCGILSKHNLCATSITAKYIAEATGLEIEKLLSGEQGGKQQIASRIAFNEIDVLLYFKDTRPDAGPDSGEAELLRLCDLYNVPVATNIATAEELMDACLTRLGVAQCFSFLLSCETVGAGKSRPDVYWEAAKRLGAEPAEIAVYEDALYAAETAKSDGFYTVAVRDDSNQLQWEFLTALADEVILDWQRAAQTL